MAASKVKKLIFPNVAEAENPLNNISGAGNFMNGVERVGIDSLMDPLTTGYAFIKWIRLPFWFEKNDDLKHFATLTENAFKSFSGVNDIELQTNSRQTGFANRSIESVSGISNSNTDFQMEFDEYSGSPFRNMIWLWINMVRDERTGLARYPEIYNCEYGARNHTADLLYIMVRPDADNIGNKNRIEYAAYYTNVFPKNVPDSSLYNYSLGSNDNPRITLQFSGFCERGPAINAYALKVLDDVVVSRKSGVDSKIFLDSLTSNSDVVSLLGETAMKQISKDYISLDDANNTTTK